MQALDGIKVLDFTVEVAGPTCGMILADLGAETIKIERPGSGEHARSVGAFKEKNLGAYYFQFNRNKKSLTLDLKRPEGKEILFRLAKTADVFVENYSPGVVQRLGIDYDHLRQINPQIIYCSISGFGKLGSQVLGRSAYNIVAMGEAGLLSPYDATSLRPIEPTKPQVAFIDLGTGMYAALAILASLIARPILGKGQYVDMSMIKTALSWREDMAMYDTHSMENYVLIGPDRPFKTRTKWITISCATDDHFQNLFKVLGISKIIEEDQELGSFNSDPTRKKYEKFIDILEREVAKWDYKELLATLSEAHVPCGRVNSLDDIFEDKSMDDMLLKLKHPLGRVNIRVPDIPYYLSETPGKVRYAAPSLGEHSVEILKELGYSESEIQKFTDLKVI